MTNVAILGFGTVGSGVAELLEMNRALIAGRFSGEIRIKYILDVRDFPKHPLRDRFVKDFSVIESDPEVDIVVETIGGAGVALEFSTRALKAGKSVVTSNKELVATRGYELLQLAREHGANYLFEASVGGGIPILHPLQRCLAGNDFSEVVGILNGTTNYILTRMIRSGLTFQQALKEAQDLGYAERDPSADVDGFDACRKICILAAIAFGQHVFPEQVPTRGIRDLTLEDVAYAAAGGYRIKLLGRALRRKDGKLCAFVEPELVPDSNPLSGVVDVFNAICVRGNAVGDVMFYGRGAGKLPTASAVVGDIMDLAEDLTRDRHNQWGPGGAELTVSPEELASPWYLRARASEEELQAMLGQVRILKPEVSRAGETGLITADMTAAQLAARLGGLKPERLLRVLN